MPPSSKRSRLSKQIHVNLKRRKLEEEARLKREAIQRAEDLTEALGFVYEHTAALQALPDPEQRVPATIVTFDALLDTDLLTSEWTAPLYALLSGRVFAVPGKPKALFCLKRVDFCGFVWIENKACKALSLEAKAAAMSTLWEGLEQELMRTYVAMKDAYVLFLGADVNVHMMMLPARKFLNQAEDTLPESSLEHDKEILEERRKAEEEIRREEEIERRWAAIEEKQRLEDEERWG